MAVSHHDATLRRLRTRTPLLSLDATRLTRMANRGANRCALLYCRLAQISRTCRRVQKTWQAMIQESYATGQGSTRPGGAGLAGVRRRGLVMSLVYEPQRSKGA